MEMSFVMIKARIAEDADATGGALPRVPVELEAKMRELGANGVEAQGPQHLRKGVHGR